MSDEEKGHVVLTRMEGERIEIGDDIIVAVARIGYGKVRIMVTAPKSIRVDRSEVRRRIELNRARVNRNGVRDGYVPRKVR